MSGGRLIFTFRNGIGFALDKAKIEEGAVIEFDLDFDQIELDYEGSALTVINRNEFCEQRPVLRFKNKNHFAAEKKRKLERIDEAESSNTAINRMKSMVMTSKGELVGAIPTDNQPEGKATLTRTQKRNRNRRIHKMLEQMKEQAKALDQSNGIPLQPMEVEEKMIFKEKQIEQRIVEVEPYIPQFVNRKRPLQIIPEHEMEKYEKVRKQNFEHFQRLQGKYVNILEGLELHTNVFNRNEQDDIIERVFLEQNMGRAGRLRTRTYSEPKKWKRGKGRVTIQYGCCYNFARDKEGNPPGIIRHDEVDPLPSFIKRIIKRLVTWCILPADCIPNSCIINIYEAGDCIPPHIDHHDFERPFCTVSFINKCNIMFGTEIQIVGDGEFQGSVEIPLPVGSVLVLKGNGANVAKHCIPGVPYPRISITLRRMNEDKVPFKFRPDPEIENLQPFEL